jgi:hypothetical protein
VCLTGGRLEVDLEEACMPWLPVIHNAWQAVCQTTVTQLVDTQLVDVHVVVDVDAV